MSTNLHPASVAVERDRVPVGTALSDLAQRIFDGDRIQYAQLGLVDEYVVEVDGVPSVLRHQVRTSDVTDGRLARELMVLALAPATGDEFDLEFVRLIAANDAREPGAELRRRFDQALAELRFSEPGGTTR
ncbi:MAG: hypothetical protein PGN13_11210 [Patulibacter minatonensis]